MLLNHLEYVTGDVKFLSHTDWYDLDNNISNVLDDMVLPITQESSDGNSPVPRNCS